MLDRSVVPPEASNRIRERMDAARSDQPSVWARIDADERIASTLPFVWYCSEFVAASCLGEPRLLIELIESRELFEAMDADALKRQLQSVADALDVDAELLAALRRFRRKQMVRIAWRDLAGWADTPQTLIELSNLADASIEY